MLFRSEVVVVGPSPAPRRDLVEAASQLLAAGGRAELLACCSEPPEGRERSSLRLLADRMVELGYADELSYEMVRRTLKKNELKPHLKLQCVVRLPDSVFEAADNAF